MMLNDFLKGRKRLNEKVFCSGFIFIAWTYKFLSLNSYTLYILHFYVYALKFYNELCKRYKLLKEKDTM